MTGLLKEEAAVWALCALAAARVLFACAAFPFFNSSDEQMHFDLVYKYAHGNIPARVAFCEPKAVRDIALFGSLEFFNAPASFPGGRMPPPLWERAPHEAAAGFIEREKHWGARRNMESNQSPLYYVAAAAWYRLGQALGLVEGDLLYWLRFLNAAVMALLIGTAHLALKRLFPRDPSYSLGVPLLIAAFPQDAFYGITNDSLSPLCFGAAFFLLLEACFLKPRDLACQAAAGALTAAAILVKWPNVAIVPVLALFLALRLRERGLKDGRAAILMLLAAAFLPVAAWCVWKYAAMGQFTGYAETQRLAGWTPKPLGQILPHPMFTLRGAEFFLSSFWRTLWRGEYLWHGRPLWPRAADLFFTASSYALLSAALVSLWRGEGEKLERIALLGALVALGAYLAQLAAISVRFDFGGYFYPSRRLPFLYSGRLALGALVPFLMLYLRGLKTLAPGLSAAARLKAAAALAVLVGAAGLLSLRPILASRYNWFHLPDPSATMAFESSPSRSRVLLRRGSGP